MLNRTPSATGGPATEQAGLFTAGPRRLPIVPPVIVLTSGRVETAVVCPSCGHWHRHASLGTKTAPCGARYAVKPRRSQRGSQ